MGTVSGLDQSRFGINRNVRLVRFAVYGDKALSTKR